MPLILGTNSIKDTSYNVANSLRFNDDSSDFLNRTPSSAGNRRTFTISAWVKRGQVTTNSFLFGAWTADNDAGHFAFGFESAERLTVDTYSTNLLTSTRVFRDPNAWYHVVCAVDTTSGTADQRVRLYVNGTEETVFSTRNNPSQNADLQANNSVIQVVGANYYNSQANVTHDGYMAEFCMIDGQQLDATSFGEFSEDSPNIWIPKDVSGLTFGTNGFYLDFENSGSLGADVSGNSNNFTVNNLTSVDQSTDTCTNNFCTLNPLLDVYNPAIFSNGNLTATGSGSGNGRYAFSSFAVANGKWYYEVKVTVAGSNPYVGVIDAQSTLRRNSIYFVAAASGTNQSGYAVNMTGDIYHNNSNSYAANISNTSTGDILGFAIDLDSAQRTCEIYRNGSSQRSFNLDEPTSGFYLLGASSTYNQSSAVADMNFGSPAYAISSGNQDGNGYGNFEYAVPSGYFALCTKNLAEYG